MESVTLEFIEQNTCMHKEVQQIFDNKTLSNKKNLLNYTFYYHKWSICKSHQSKPEQLMLAHTDYFRQFFDMGNLTLHDNMCL